VYMCVRCDVCETPEIMSFGNVVLLRNRDGYCKCSGQDKRPPPSSVEYFIATIDEDTIYNNIIS